MVTRSGSTSASNVIAPQWQRPSTFMLSAFLTTVSEFGRQEPPAGAVMLLSIAVAPSGPAVWSKARAVPERRGNSPCRLQRPPSRESSRRESRAKLALQHLAVGVAGQRIHPEESLR